MLELIVWDKDLVKKEYLGEASLELQDWFGDKPAKAYDDPDNKVSFPYAMKCTFSE